MTATTVGARNRRVRSVSSRAAEGVSLSSARHALSRTRPKAARASPSKRMNRQGSSFLWSGTRAAAVRMVSSWAGVGPGSPSIAALADRRFNSSSRVSWLMGIALGVSPARIASHAKALAKPTRSRVQWVCLGDQAGEAGFAMGNRYCGGAQALLLAALLCAFATTAARGNEPASAILVFDGSASMWGDLDGPRNIKLTVAREAVRRALGKIGSQTRVGLASFGHRRGDCADVEVMRPARARRRGAPDGAAGEAQSQRPRPGRRSPFARRPRPCRRRRPNAAWCSSTTMPTTASRTSAWPRRSCALRGSRCTSSASP